MEPTHIFYNELKIDDNNEFTANISEKNEVENIILQNTGEYAVTGMTITPDIVHSNLVKVTNQEKLNSLSKRIQELVKNYKEPNLDLTISNPETKSLVIPFQKKSKTAVPPIKLTFYNTKTKKNEEFSVYNYYKHLKDYGFDWENKNLTYKFTITLSKDEKKLTKK